MVQLGKIEKVNVRDIWPNEAADFTPWLADNLDQLGKVLNCDLELDSTEAPVGNYRLDILARVVNTDELVAIENQIADTDHRHLGQLLTYASGHDAKIVVWIAKEFNDEHRKALDWLNQRTDENTIFFGVVVELWKIDSSRPAVNFKLAAAPNEGRKQNIGSQRSSEGSRSVRDEQYREFYQPLIDVLREDHKFTNVKKPGTKPFCNFATGLAGFRYAPYLTTSNMNRASVQLYLDSDRGRNKSCFDGLIDDKTAIEGELGELTWERLDNRKACRISVERPGSIDDDSDALDEIRDWMLERLLKFKQVFGPRLDELG